MMHDTLDLWRRTDAIYDYGAGICEAFVVMIPSHHAKYREFGIKSSVDTVTRQYNFRIQSHFHIIKLITAHHEPPQP